MTKAHALKLYFKKQYDLDVEGMSTVEVLRNYLSQHLDRDVNGSSVVSVLLDAVGEDGEDRPTLFDGVIELTQQGQSEYFHSDVFEAELSGVLSVAVEDVDTHEVLYQSDYLEYSEGQQGAGYMDSTIAVEQVQGGWDFSSKMFSAGTYRLKIYEESWD